MDEKGKKETNRNTPTMEQMTRGSAFYRVTSLSWVSVEFELRLRQVWVNKKCLFFYRKCIFTFFCFSLFLVCLYFCCCVFVIGAGSYPPARENETLHGRMLLERTVLYTCSVRVRFFDLLFQTCVQNCGFLLARYPASSLVLTDLSS